MRWLGHPGAQSYWQPSSSDVERIHGCLRSELEAGLADPARLDYRQEQLDSRLRWLQGELRIVLGQLERYRQQFVGLTLADGSRQILVRCFPGEQMQPAFDFPNWRRELVVVCDGGADYWYAVFDAESGRLLLFSSNGYA